MDIPEVLPTHMPGKAQTDSWSQYRSLFLLLLGIVCGGAVWRAGVIQDAYAWITAIPQGSIETVLQIEAPSLSSPEARRRLTDKLDAIESLLQKVDYVPSPVVHNQTSSNQDSPFREPRRGSTLDKIVLSGPIEPKDFPQSEIGEASTEGNAARYPIERFSTPKVYEIIARTQILKDPSYTAEVVGTLHVGHRVEANAQYGPWLRLRSKSGRDGFILVQDSKDTGS